MRPRDRVAPVTLPDTSGSGRALERNPVDAERPHKARNSRQLPGLAFLPPARTIKEVVGPQGGSMPDMIRQVDYYYTMAPDKAGEGARLLAVLRNAGVNLLAFSAFPSARKSQADFVPADGAAFVAAAKQAKIKLKGPKKCYLIDRKSTRLNSSHGYISYAVFCLKKKNTTRYPADRDYQPRSPRAAPQRNIPPRA